MSASNANTYPARFDVPYPGEWDRVTTLFRIVLVIPIAILAALVGATARFLWGAVVLMILFRGRYPRPWFEWALYIQQFTMRVNAYVLLLSDKYPSTTEAQRVTAEADLDEASLNRWMPLVKWLLAIPHFIVIAVLGVGMAIVTLIAWFAILFTGRYPRALHEFSVGVQRWSWRVLCYAFLLSTDRYPPFSLK